MPSEPAGNAWIFSEFSEQPPSFVNCFTMMNNDDGNGQVELTTPLDIETGNALDLPDDPVTDQGFLKPIPETTSMERVAGAVGITCVLTAIVAMIVEQSAIVIVGGILSAILGPYAYYQQTRLTDIKALKETQEVLHGHVDTLSNENERLSNNVEDLTTSVQKLSDIQEALDTITAQQGQSVQAFEEMVQENRSMLESMQTNLKANVLQNLVSVIIRSDTDQDMIMDDAEIDHLMRRIQNLSGVELHEDRFRKKIANKSIADVMEVVKNLVHNEELPPEERIFDLAQ